MSETRRSVQALVLMSISAILGYLVAGVAAGIGAAFGMWVFLSFWHEHVALLERLIDQTNSSAPVKSREDGRDRRRHADAP
jgi:hypothetical protein